MVFELVYVLHTHEIRPAQPHWRQAVVPHDPVPTLKVEGLPWKLPTAQDISFILQTVVPHKEAVDDQSLFVGSVNK